MVHAVNRFKDVGINYNFVFNKYDKVVCRQFLVWTFKFEVCEFGEYNTRKIARQLFPLNIRPHILQKITKTRMYQYMT